VLYVLPNKEACPAKVVRIVDAQRRIVNLTIFTDVSDRTHENAAILRDVPFADRGLDTPNTWHPQEEAEQTRAAGQGR
jgi:hypothetical protein